MARMTDTELCAGRRADFHVYYRRNGKLMFDAMWAPNAEDAEKKTVAAAKSLRWKIEVVKIVPITPDA